MPNTEKVEAINTTGQESWGSWAAEINSLPRGRGSHLTERWSHSPLLSRSGFKAVQYPPAGLQPRRGTVTAGAPPQAGVGAGGWPGAGAGGGCGRALPAGAASDAPSENAGGRGAAGAARGGSRHFSVEGGAGLGSYGLMHLLRHSSEENERREEFWIYQTLTSFT